MNECMCVGGDANMEWDGGLGRHQSSDCQNPDKEDCDVCAWHSHPQMSHCLQAIYLIVVFVASHPVL